MKRILTLLLLMPLMALAGTIGEALNCTSLTWTTGGTPSRVGEGVDWFCETGDSYSDGMCAASGAGGAGDATSWLKTTIVGPAKISYRYKVQTYNGSFKVTRGSVVLYRYSGVTGTSVSWQFAEYDIPEGRWELKFEYHHPGMGYANRLNGVRIDNFTVTTYNRTLASALGADGLIFTTGGNADWFVQNEEKDEGQDAVRSGAIGNNQSSWMQTTISGAKQVSFWWKVSSEAGYDFLKFYVDGTEWKSVSGTGGSWVQETVLVTGTGTHTLRWQYSKDDSQSSGSDCGWVDQLVITDVQIGPSTTYYVNGIAGRDSNSGLSANAAKRTIQAAIDSSASGDTILVSSGVYARIDVGAKSVTIRSISGPLQTIIDARSSGRCAKLYCSSGTNNSNGDGVPDPFSNRFSYATIDGFTLQNGYVRGENCGGGGALNGCVRNCILRNNYTDWVNNDLDGCTAINCLFLSTGKSATAWCAHYNCVFVGGGKWLGRAYNCIFSGTSGSSFDGNRNFTGNPFFVDAENGDYRLSPCSPCIDAGSNAYVAIATDLDGKARVANGVVDIGCYEYGSSSAITDGLVAWYKFDGDADDSSGNGFDMDENHSAVGGVDRFGRSTSSLYFNGESYLQRDRELGITNSMTIAFWAYPESDATIVRESTTGMGLLLNRHPLVINPSGLWGDSGAGVGISMSRQQIIVIEGSSFYYAPTLAYSSDFADKWTHVAVVISGNEAPQLFVNGAFVRTGLQNGRQKAVGGRSIGGVEPSDNNAHCHRNYKGNLDEMVFYGRALSAAEISALYNGDKDSKAYYTVTFNANGGVAVASHRVEYGAEVGELPTAEKDGAMFLGWFTAATGGTQVTAKRTITEDVMFYAHWREIPLSDAVGGGAYVITTGGDANWFAESANKVEGLYAAQSGMMDDEQSCWMQMTVTGPNDVSFKWMVSSEEGYDWLKVYVDGVEKDAISGSVAWREKTLSIVGDGAHIIKWVYSKDSSQNVGDDCGRVDALTVTPTATPPPAVVWTVMFNANGGTAAVSEKSVADGQAVGTLPTAEREGFDFDGWYTAALGGRAVTAATVVTADVEYFAHWRSAEVVPTYDPWGESSAVKNPDKLGPTYLQNMSVTIYGTLAEEGDVVAVYREDTGALCGLGKVLDDSGALTMVCYAPKGVTLHFKAWVAASGINEPQIFDGEEESDLIAPDVGAFVNGHELVVSTEAEIPPIVPGAKVNLDTGLIGYTVKGLPRGLKYDKRTGTIAGAAKKPTGEAGVMATFTKKGEKPLTARFVVGPLPAVSVALAGDAAGCRVTGAGKACLAGKKVTLAAKAPKGTAFAGWTRDGAPWPDAGMARQAKLSFVMPAEDVALVASFERERMSVACPALAEASLAVGVAGEEEGFPLEIEAQSGVKSVKAKGLPSGMRLAKDRETGAWRIVGAPKRAGSYKVALTATAASGAQEKVMLEVEVMPLPEWAVGTFVGSGEHHGMEDYAFVEDNLQGTVTVAASGKVSGKILLDTAEGRLLTAAFSAPALTGYDADMEAYYCDVEIAFRDGRTVVEERTRRLYIAPDAYDGDGVRTVGHAFVSGDDGFTLDLFQNVWKLRGFGDLPSFAARKTVVSKTLGIHGDLEASGTSTLTLEIGPKGVVSATLASEGVDGDGPVRERATARGELIVHGRERDPDCYEASVALAFRGIGLVAAEVELRVSEDGKVHAEGCEITDCTDFADWGN